MKTPLEIGKEYVEGIRTMNAQKVADLFADDFVGIFPSKPNFTLQGKQHVLENDQQLFNSIQVLDVNLLHIVADDKQVVLEMEDKGLKKTGEDFYLRFMVLFEINDKGKIQKAVVYDNAGISALRGDVQ